jgi:hypothetical protein
VSNDPVFLINGQKHGVAISTDKAIWTSYDYADSIYYRVREPGMGEVKWNAAIKQLEFERPPVSIPIMVDIAVPIRSLSERISVLESQGADNEEVIAQKIRDAIESLGLDIPLERLRAMRDKVIVETGINVDNRKQAYGYDFFVYNKFFGTDLVNNCPEGILPIITKAGSTTLYSNGGLVHDEMGKIYNPTGRVIQLFSRIYATTEMPNGHIRFEVNGDLNCLSFRITSSMNVSPFDPSIHWIAIPQQSMGVDVNLSGDASFCAHHNFGVEITILPGGWIYDWALFMKKV